MVDLVEDRNLDDLALRPVPLRARPHIRKRFMERLSPMLGWGFQPLKRRFELIGRPRSGSTSRVFTVVDPKSQEQFCLKVRYNPEEPGEHEADDQFTEGEVVAHLKHDRLVKVFEHGETRRGQYYLLMEYLPGETLANLVESRRKTPVGCRLNLVREAAEALNAVHQAGFLHCDVCTENFIVSPMLDHLTLIDFGSAIPAPKNQTNMVFRAQRTDYLPPEILYRRTLDLALDVFAFGVTAYQIMTGKLPWQPDSGKSSVSRALRRPIDIRTMCPQIEGTLAAAIHACLCPQPDKRCPSIESFLDMISGVTTEDEPSAVWITDPVASQPGTVITRRDR